MEELSLLQQGYYLLGVKNFDAAKALFEQAISEKEEPGAYIGLLLAEHSLRGEDQLIELPEPLMSYEVYQKALECADDGGRAMLAETAKKQKSVLEKKKEKYGLLAAVKPDELNDCGLVDEWILTASSLGDYKDSPKIKEELQKRKETLEDAAKKKKKRMILIFAPICAAAVIALVVAGILFALPKINGVRYALWFGGYSAISCDKDIENVVLEEKINGIEVTGIGRKAFKNCENLRSVTLGAYVTTIERAAFNDCRKLETVSGSEQVTSVAENAFKDCKSLKILRFAENCEIDPDAFRGCAKDLEVRTGEKLWQRGGAPGGQQQGNAPIKAKKLLQI